MKGFESPTFTMIPNDFFALAPDMSLSELQILLYLMRETFGWHRPQTTITIRQLARSTGLSTRSIVDGAAKLEERGLLRRIVPPNKVTVWECVVESSTSALYFSQHRVVPRKSKPPVKEIKETIKEKKEEQAQVFRAYSSEIGILTPMIADSINEWIKDGFPIKWMCDAIHEAALQNKRNWKYCEAIIKRWDAQGSQEEMKKPVNGYKQKPNEPKAFEAIREFMKSQGVDNGDITGNIQDDSAYQRGVPQLECKPIHDPSLL